jgi:hypothetical protein
MNITLDAIVEEYLERGLTPEFKEKVLSFVIGKLEKQPTRSFNTALEVCVYLDGPSGHKCSIGHLIPKRFQEKVFNTQSLNQLSVRDLVSELYPEKFIPCVPKDLCIFLDALQWIHDTSRTWGPDGFNPERAREEYQNFFDRKYFS